MSYGHFSEDGDEFIITTPETPRPWINYLSNGEYCGLVSNTGGGFSFYRDHRFHGVLRREFRQFSDDLPARLWYIQDERGEYWTANGLIDYDRYEARHGPGYTNIRVANNNISTRIEWFASPEIDGEFATFTIRNDSDKPQAFKVFSYLEFILGNFMQDAHERTFANLFLRAEPTTRGLALYNNRWSLDGAFAANDQWPLKAYVVSDTAPEGWTGNRDDFVGYKNSLLTPKLLKINGSLPPLEDTQTGIDPASIFQWNVTLEPGGEQSIALLCGVTGRDEAIPSITKQHVTEQRAACADYWSRLMDTVKVETPDRELNFMVNYWNKLQMMVNNWFGRGPSYYHKDQYPAMRDCCQDSYGVLPVIPEQTRAKLVRVFGFMFTDGRIGKGCNRVVYSEQPTDKADLALWMVLALKSYLVETGDETILDEVIPFLDGGESSLYDHLIRGLSRVADDTGPHGLPLIRNGDWNDALDMIGDKGVGESIWQAQFLCYCLREAETILARKNDAARIDAFNRIADQMERNLLDTQWDEKGGYFIRAFTDEGKRFGCSDNEEGYIYLNPQTWGVIAGVGTAEQQRKALEAVDRHLETDFGLMNLYPAYSRPDPGIGIISRFIPGHKENGAVFSHATAFHLIARAKLGDAEGLYRIYRKSLPCCRDQDVYKVEPYVHSQFAASPASPHQGEGAYHWLTGTAAWMFRAVVDFMLGVQPTEQGLQIKPCLPASFTAYTVTRTFRDTVYRIEARNPEGLATGTVQLVVDGEPIEGDTVPITSAARCHVAATLRPEEKVSG